MRQTIVKQSKSWWTIGSKGLCSVVIHVRVWRRVKLLPQRGKIRMKGSGTLMTTLALRSALMKLMITMNIVLYVAFYFMPETTILCHAGSIDHPSYVTSFKTHQTEESSNTGCKLALQRGCGAYCTTVCSTHCLFPASNDVGMISHPSSTWRRYQQYALSEDAVLYWMQTMRAQQVWPKASVLYCYFAPPYSRCEKVPRGSIICRF